MRLTNLRIYHEPETPEVFTNQAPENVTVPLSEILPLLADAVNSQRTWIRDFEDDDVTISADLYGVLLAYRFYHAPPLDRA